MDENVLAGALAMKATPEQLAQLQAQTAPPAATGAYEVWPENWPVWEFFCSVQSQWIYTENRQTGARRFDRLDYPGVEAAARMRRVPRGVLAEWFADLQGMERAICSASAKAFEHEQPVGIFGL